VKLAWLAIFFTVLIWSGINPEDFFTWFLEVFPALIGLAVLAVTHRTFPLTGLAYGLILVHCIILMVGGHYTYAKVPVFDYIAELFELERNNYDKVGHFAQGFVPAILAREIFLRKKVINSHGWLNFLVVCFCLAFSAFYELIEWWVAIGTGESAEAFLGTQGYIWDTQSDMALALVGALSALLLLSSYHNTQIKKYVGGGSGEYLMEHSDV
jgi:putative membrane protein